MPECKTVALRPEGERLSSEKDTIERILQGEKEEFSVLVKRYQDTVFSLIMRQIGNEDVAKDLAQEVFLKAYEKIGTFRHEAKFSTWLIRIALNHTNSYFASRRYKESLKNQDLNMEAHGNSTTEHQMEERKEKEKVEENVKHFHIALSNLNPKFREVLVICGLEGKSYEEAAKILVLPIGTIRSRLNRARLLLKESIERISLVGEPDGN